MARRPKGPTPEELIEKLKTEFEVFKEESNKRSDEIERKGEEQLENLLIQEIKLQFRIIKSNMVLNKER